MIGLLLITWTLINEYKNNNIEVDNTVENGENPLDNQLLKKEPKMISVWVFILIGILSSAFIKALITTNHYTNTDKLVLFLIILVLIAFLVYFFFKHYGVFSIIKMTVKKGNPDELLKWYDLKEKGVISESEFEEHKQRILKTYKN